MGKNIPLCRLNSLVLRIKLYIYIMPITSSSGQKVLKLLAIFFVRNGLYGALGKLLIFGIMDSIWVRLEELKILYGGLR